MREPIRVALVMGKLATGGVKSYLLGLLSHLPLPQYNFTLFVYEGFGDEDADSFLKLGVTIVSIPPASKPRALVRELTMHFRKGRYDIVHGFLNTLNPLAMLAAERAGVQVRIAENLSTGHRGEAKSLVKALLKPFACTGATDIAANSRLAAEWLYGKRAERCRIIRNPVDIAFFQNDPGERFEVRSRLGLGGSFVVGWIGRCVPQKNPLFLADILSALVARDPDVCMVVVGYGPLEGRLKDRIVALGLSESFVALGETEDIRPLYRAMDCFVLPSLYEGLPMVSVEAQAAGLPCVLSSEITREAAVGEGVAFVGLDRAANEWADTLLSFKGVGRLDNRLALHACGFDAAVSAADLDAFWRGLLRREAGRR